MRQKKLLSKGISFFGWMVVGSTICLLSPPKTNHIEAARVTGSHIGTFNGSTTFTTTSRNGINPGLFIEVMDEDGNLTQYESEEGVITVPNTKEGAYVTQAKLLGKTKYVDEDTGEVLDTWEERRNLKLVSSENPGLKITGKNPVPNQIGITLGHYWGVNPDNSLIGYNAKRTGFVTDYIPHTSLGRMYMGFKYDGVAYTYPYRIFLYDSDKNLVDVNGSFNIDKKHSYVRLSFYDYAEVFQITDPSLLSDIWISDEDIPTPYQSSTLTVNEDVTLRGIGDVRDTLDLITGEVIQSTGEVLLSEFNSYATTTGNGMYYIAKTHVAEDFATNHTLTIEPNEMIVKVHSESIGNLEVQVVQKEDGSYPTRNELQAYLSQSPIVMQYERSLPISETVNLASDYYFQAVTNQNIQVNGEVEPLVVSITVPTDALTFTLNPNQEAGQQFIAPDFMLTNETLAPLQIELKNFEQTTDVLNDVLPEAHESWEGLNKKESKDIALALVPTPSDGWLSLNESSCYVANTSDELIGTVKGKSSVEFSFDALHGQAFSEVLNPEYRLSFVFGFIR